MNECEVCGCLISKEEAEEDGLCAFCISDEEAHAGWERDCFGDN